MSSSPSLTSGLAASISVPVISLFKLHLICSKKKNIQMVRVLLVFLPEVLVMGESDHLKD